MENPLCGLRALHKNPETIINLSGLCGFKKIHLTTKEIPSLAFVFKKKH